MNYTNFITLDLLKINLLMKNQRIDRSTIFTYANGQRFKGKGSEEIFNSIQGINFWEEGESISGPGATLMQTAEIIEKLPAILDKLKVRRMLDLPCGDFNWMQKVGFKQVKYTGGDIVESIIDRNNKLYRAPNRVFKKINLLSDNLGEHDLIFCRDCLVHFSYKDINHALINLKKQDITFLMTTTFPDEPKNKDIPTGGWRPLNLSMAPFYFPLPLVLLNEKCTEMNGIFGDKSLAVWKIDDLKLFK